MVYSERLYQPSVLELARQGNLQAIAYWINSYLVPQGIYASVRASRAGCLQILIEFQRIPERDRLVRFICHRLYKLNSNVIAGVQIVARFAGDSRILWQQSVRLAPSPRRQRSQRRQRQSQSYVKQLLDQHTYLKLARSLLLSGSAVAAFVLGCLLSYNESPTTPTIASALQRSQPSSTSNPSQRSNVVRAALEKVPVIQHENILNTADPNVTLMFGGDVTLADAFADMVGDDYRWAFADMNEYRQADVAMVNLENPLTEADTPLANKAFNFKADPDAVKVLTEGGVDIVTLANNHAMDYEAAGLAETMRILDEAGIHHIGAGQDIQEARRPEILEVKGQRIAYLGYYDDDLHAASEETPGTNARQNDRVAADIRAVRSQVDWIVVNYHWGEELAEYPSEQQVDLARFTIDQGADLVVGHHPHVLQGAEIYKGRPIAYSLGNFIFGGNARSDYDTAVLKVALRDKQMKVEFLPVEVTQYQPEVVEGDRGAQILAQIEERSRIFDQPMPTSVILDARSSKILSPEESKFDSQPMPSDDSELSAPQPLTPQPQPSPADSFINDSEGLPNQAPEDLGNPGDDSAAPLNTQPSLEPSDRFTDPSGDSAWPTNNSQPFTAPTPELSTPTSEPSAPLSDPGSSQPFNSQPLTAPSDSTNYQPYSSPTTPETDTPERSYPSSSPADSFTTPYTPESSPSPTDSFTTPSETAPNSDSLAPEETETDNSEPSNELRDEGSQEFYYPYREEPDDYWQPLTPDPSTPPEDLPNAPTEETEETIDPSTPLNEQPATDSFTEPPASEPEAIPDSTDPQDSLEFAPSSPTEEESPTEPSPSPIPWNAPGNSSDPFISAPTETAPTPLVPETQDQPDSEPQQLQPQAPEPGLAPSGPRKQTLRERIALLSQR